MNIKGNQTNLGVFQDKQRNFYWTGVSGGEKGDLTRMLFQTFCSLGLYALEFLRL